MPTESDFESNYESLLKKKNKVMAIELDNLRSEHQKSKMRKCCDYNDYVHFIHVHVYTNEMHSIVGVSLSSCRVWLCFHCPAFFSFVLFDSATILSLPSKLSLVRICCLLSLSALNFLSVSSACSLAHLCLALSARSLLCRRVSMWLVGVVLHTTPTKKLWDTAGFKPGTLNSKGYKQRSFVHSVDYIHSLRLAPIIAMQYLTMHTCIKTERIA